MSQWVICPPHASYAPVLLQKVEQLRVTLQALQSLVTMQAHEVHGDDLLDERPPPVNQKAIDFLQDVTSTITSLIAEGTQARKDVQQSLQAFAPRDAKKAGPYVALHKEAKRTPEDSTSLQVCGHPAPPPPSRLYGCMLTSEHASTHWGF